MKFEHLNISDNVVKISRRKNDLEYDIYTITLDNEVDAKYIAGLKSLNIPVYINNDYYEIISVQYSGSNIVLVGKRLSGIYKITSENTLITNSFIDATTQQPTIMLPKGTKVMYDGILPKTEGLVDVYKTTSKELVEPIPTTMIKVYDDMGTTDETQWKLVSNPEEHTFVGNWIIEYGNIRWRSDSATFIWNGTQWISNGSINVRFVMYNQLRYLHDTNQKNQPFTIKDNKMIINAAFSRSWTDNIKAYKTLEFTFENGYIRCSSEADSLESIYYISPVLSRNNIVINSDYIIKLGGKETDYTINSGSKGWILYYSKTTNIPVICYSSGANLGFSRSNGDTMVNNFYNIPLVNYIGKLFNEAENGTIIGGTSTEDADASGGYAVQGDGATLSVDIINTQTMPAFKLPAGDYTVIYRLKASSTSLNDSINITVKNLTTATNIDTVTKTASDIGTTYSYHTLSMIGYNGTDDYSIVVDTGANVDASLFSVDYVVIVPTSEITELQKRVFVNNNQRLTVQ